MAFFYTLYGLTLSSNLPIPGLVSAACSAGVDVHVTLGGPHRKIKIAQDPWYISPYVYEDSPNLIIWKSVDGSRFRFLYCDQTEFLIDRVGTQVSATWPDELTLENTITYLVSPILAFILRLRRLVCLHASSILVDNLVVAIVGNTGTGKSTTAASFVKQGYPVLSEDVTALIDRDLRYLVQPGYPRLNLWPEAVNSLHGHPDALPKIAPPWEKRYLDLQRDGDHFYSRAAPLGAAYVLANRSAEQTAPFIESLSTRDALIQLLTNTHSGLLMEKPMRSREFDVLSRLAEVIPVRRVVPHIDVARLDDLREMILRDFRHSAASAERTVEVAQQ